MARTALVLGAGLGGLVAAEELRNLLPADDRIVVVERNGSHHFPPSLPWLMVGHRSEAAISRSYERLDRRGIVFRQGEVTRIDPTRRSAEIDGQAIAADALIVALGADYADEAIPGLAQAGLSLYTLDGAHAIRQALATFKGGRIVILTAAPAYKCPAAPYEAALLVEASLRRGGGRSSARIDFFAAEAAPMAVTGPQIGDAVRGMLQARGIGYFPEHQVTTVDAAARKLVFANEAEADFDLLLYVPPHRAPAAVREAGLCNESGWVPVDRHTLQTRFDGVHAIGDVTTIPLAMGRPLPKAGVFAHGQAEVVAHNIARMWTGKGEARQFQGAGMCFIETGERRAGMGKGNFYAEPTPQVRMHAPGLLWHAGKIAYEKYWLWSRF